MEPNTSQPQQPAEASASPGAPAGSPISPANSVPVASQPVAQEKTDALGIVSIVLALAGITPIGLIVGLVGASHAKKEGRSPILSKVGWILNLVFTLLAVLAFAALLMLSAIASRK